MFSRSFRFLSLCALLAIVGVGCRKDASEKPTPMPSPPTASERPKTPQTADTEPTPTPQAPIDPRGKMARIVTSRGALDMEFFADDAPKTAANFIRLAQSGFYNGVRFHRVEPGTLVQTGDPTGTGSGGAGWTIPFEKNDRHHLIGSVAMARGGDDKDSASSQFYICLRPLLELDGEYTIFGRITSGFDALPQITQGDVVERVEIAPMER